MRRRQLLASLSLMMLAGCGASQTAATISDDQATLKAVTPHLQYVPVSGELVAPPTVMIRDRELHALSGRRVRFTLTSGSDVREFIVASDASGRAVFPRLSLDSLGRYRIEAHLGITNMVRFDVVALPAALMSSPTASRCSVLDDGPPQVDGIPRIAAALREQRPVTIVALGSSSTFGTGASDTSLSYPSQFARELQRVFPISEIRMVNAGVPGNVATDLEQRLEKDVLANAPDLVILQTGVNDALKQLPIPAVRSTTARTIARIKAGGGDVLLLDSQFFPGAEKPAYQEYVAALAQEGTALGVSTVRRYGWMRAVIAAQRYTMTDLITKDGLHQTDLASECTAHLLAAGITATVYGRAP
jgi:lysophospholipase L1-like esterase